MRSRFGTMPRSFLIKKHLNAGAAAISRPVAFVKRPWLDEGSFEAEDLSMSPPPAVRVPLAISPALSDGCVPGQYLLGRLPWLCYAHLARSCQKF